ncbi:MAG TPA: hemolysin III family protein [Spirochaetota bacterium]|nr:hemolysin III family protein [Spirochaetota bacterium]
MKTEKKIKRSQTSKEEFFNFLTHGTAALLSIAGLVFLVVGAAIGGDPWRIVSMSIYGASLVMLYCASTFYHFAKDSQKKSYLKIFDHTSIYFLIAGSYTPYVLVTINGTIGWVIFGIVWGITIIGIVFKFKYVGQFKKLSLALYLGMGWVIIFAIRDIVEALPSGGLLLLVLGGVAYSVGTIFYAKDSKPYFHAIWHLFVMAGSIFHYMSISMYVLPK